MADSVSFTLNDGPTTETVTIQRTAQYVHLKGFNGGFGPERIVSIPRELLPAVVVTLQRELKDE